MKTFFEPPGTIISSLAVLVLAPTDLGGVDDHGDVLAAASGVGPDVIIGADRADAVEPGGIIDQQLLDGLEGRAVCGVPDRAEVLSNARDRYPVDDHALQRPVDRVTRRLRAGGGSGRGVLPPHCAVVAAAVAVHSDLQHRRSPAERDVYDRFCPRAAGNTSLAAAAAVRVGLQDPPVQYGTVELDSLPGGCEPEPVPAAEGIESRGRGGSVGRAEVFQMASVRTSIIGRPRRLSRHRRALPELRKHTLICEEPARLFRDECGVRRRVRQR